MQSPNSRPGWRLLAPAVALFLGACAQLPFGGDKAQEPAAADAPEVTSISAQTPQVKAYRKVAARHIYARYPKKIYPAKIPPLVYAVVVVETHLDADGNVQRVAFSRTPGHAPEVPPEIADMIRACSPFPGPGAVGAHTYVDTWLWDKSGRFQLDTLTQGQRSR